MEKSESRGDAASKVLCTMEEEAQEEKKTPAEGTGARLGAKKGGVIPAERRLVKRMMWDRFVNWVCVALGPCFRPSDACSEPDGTKKMTVGAAEVAPLPGEH
ncbi:hypothetical protein NL676_027831 [Syzygium grande]|nr:hypothetical protein NL676_027831 [Syzygium grande]